ncbi:hypothetical protein FHX49_000938 [Microbacterium endophyticum]|uniref:Uncharacterized protein n=1 Tax=Microbacterium endophyticum TaxID=1526412 RepID=A0A7W4V203_9MICO|nr:hypothetical protein [Microbacterium endophyticum]NIK35609.1 hypothetical protein [Microbacterium endophyticum]
MCCWNVAAKSGTADPIFLIMHPFMFQMDYTSLRWVFAFFVCPVVAASSGEMEICSQAAHFVSDAHWLNLATRHLAQACRAGPTCGSALVATRLRMVPKSRAGWCSHVGFDQ